ncbi:MAG: Holliday junction DNA helicase RuvA [Candidatus Brennerbacteria bacterium RIFOXYC1_FULL_41_11]|uniref:Holliday junction branch migration complex subunit RuvA n=1 Tax=Candidatus Brennerbacteria bacterium RIFOXYD1_FULL_41_16 TaxID=1797529 RepID=A0A1G1XL13_9BACT|nr:MAG: Holliday junction DNA helicase RuvA [Candidatus Brennerbacteria bacterium RIFOXYC1_FULL_41_11]OGY40594.1 MAG: Holliday junction DNA helicase RuvA [Candidatus Brennerbacteria bacterium RIFOXYD1_FULL_41_16]
MLAIKRNKGKTLTMISFLQGKLIEKSLGRVMIEAGGFGFEIFVSEECQRKIGAINKQVKLFTRVVFKQQEGVFEIFGFLTREEKEMFLLLTSVDKVGPKTALNVLGSAPIEKIKSAIEHGKTEFLNKVVGIGEKTTARLIFELQKKIKSGNLSAGIFDADVEVEGVLVSLGYSGKESKRAISQLGNESGKISDRVAKALKILSGR